MFFVSRPFWLKVSRPFLPNMASSQDSSGSSAHPYLRWGMASSPEWGGSSSPAQQLTLDGGGFIARTTPGGAALEPGPRLVTTTAIYSCPYCD
eukprot:5610760-Heterocapsa_arctica.AAC.1